MSFTKLDRAAFNFLNVAAQEGLLCLTSCTEKESGKEIKTICATIPMDDGSIQLLPVARLFEGNPLTQLNSPMKVDNKE